jgi:hypothetical protein
VIPAGVYLIGVEGLQKAGSILRPLAVGQVLDEPEIPLREFYPWLQFGEATVAVAGTAQVGNPLTATARITSGPAPTYDFHWTDGVTLLGTGPDYTPTEADRGKPLYAIAIVSATRVPTQVAASPATARVLPGGAARLPATPPGPASDALREAPLLTLGVAVGSGGVKVGAMLTAVGAPAGWATTYQWLRDGRPIAGAVTAGHRVTAADAGASLKVAATISKAGHRSRTASSTALKVPKIVPTVKVSQLASGKLQITVKAKGVAKPVGKVTVKFGAKYSKTYSLKAKNAGKLTKSLPAKAGQGKLKVTATFKGNAQIAKRKSATASISGSRGTKS